MSKLVDLFPNVFPNVCLFYRVHVVKAVFWVTWFLDDCIACVCYLLSLGLIWILVVIEVAVCSTREEDKTHVC